MIAFAKPDNVIAMPVTSLNTITIGDARELAKSIPDNSIDLIFTDPPYPKEYLSLYGWLAEEAARVLKPGGYVFAFTGNFYLVEIMAMMGKHLTYHWTIGLAHLGSYPYMHGRQMLCAYKPIVIFSKGKGNTHPYVVDLWTGGKKDKHFHIWGQDASIARYYINYFSSPGDLVWEPFCGGGTTPYICKQLNRNFIAFEVDPASVDIARKRLETVQPLLFQDEIEQPLSLWGDA